MFLNYLKITLTVDTACFPLNSNPPIVSIALVRITMRNSVSAMLEIVDLF